MPNKLIYPSDNVTTENGGEILWEEGVFKDGSALKVGYLCAAKKFLGDECTGRGSVLARRALVRGAKFRALEEACYYKILGTPYAEELITIVNNAFRTGEWLMPKGSKVRYDIREPGKSYMIGFECRGCFDSEQKNYKYIHDWTLRTYAKNLKLRESGEDKEGYLWLWDELCSDCIEKRGSAQRITGWKTARSGTRVYFPKGKGTEALIVYALCPCKKRVLRSSIINNYEDLSAACRTHTREILARVTASGALQSDNRQVPLQLDAEGLKILEIVNAVIIVWKEVNNPKLQHEENLALVKQAKVAKQLGLGDEKNPEGANALAGRLRRSRMKEAFPDNASRFRDFVKATVNDFKLGTAPEAIVFGLLHRLDAAASAA